MSQIVSALNQLIAALDLQGTVSLPPSSGTSEPVSSVTGIVVVGQTSPNGATSVTVYPPSSLPVALTFANWPVPSPLAAGDVAQHTITYHSAASQAALGVVNANDQFISISEPAA